MNITVKDSSAVGKEVRPPEHMEYDAVAWVMVTHTPILFAHSYYGTTGPRNAGYYRSEYFDERMLAAIREQDDAKRVQMLTEANLRQQDDVAAVPFAFPSWRTFWWPWVKNIHGEVWYHIHTPDPQLVARPGAEGGDGSLGTCRRIVSRIEGRWDAMSRLPFSWSGYHGACRRPSVTARALQSRRCTGRRLQQSRGAPGRSRCPACRLRDASPGGEPGANALHRSGG